MATVNKLTIKPLFFLVYAGSLRVSIIYRTPTGMDYRIFYRSYACVYTRAGLGTPTTSRVNDTHGLHCSPPTMTSASSAINFRICRESNKIIFYLESTWAGAGEQTGVPRETHRGTAWPLNSRRSVTWLPGENDPTGEFRTLLRDSRSVASYNKAHVGYTYGCSVIDW